MENEGMEDENEKQGKKERMDMTENKGTEDENARTGLHKRAKNVRS